MRFLASAVAAAVVSLSASAPALANPLDVLGSYDPGSAGFNAMAVGLDGIAYLGSWGGPGACPSLGVRIVDLRDPTAPALIGSAAVYTGTTAEHVAVAHYATPAFSGTLLAAGVQRCQPGGGAPSGLALWDVSDPANPIELGFVPTGRTTRGVHEFALRQQGDRWLAFLAVPNAEITDGSGDLRIVDVTDPRNPVELVDWGAKKNAGLPVGSGSQCAPFCRGSVPEAFLHSVALSPDGRTAYLSYWDLGVIMLDVSEPGAPRWVGRFAEPATDEGNTHSVALAHDGKLALVADETFGPPWGYLRLVDVRDPANPVELGKFQTPNGAADTPGEAYGYTIHNPLVDDRNPDRAYLAWYSDGIRLVDIADPSRPAEVASWLPPAGGMIWNVAFMGDVLLAGDINNGLYVLRR